MTTVYTITRTTEVTLHDCYKCGLPIALTRRHEEQARANGEPFCCPGGHSQVFRKTEVDRLKEQLEAANARAQTLQTQAASAQKQASEAKAKLARMTKRTAAGVCPCCNRTFQQLARHMKTKHPEVLA